MDFDVRWCALSSNSNTVLFSVYCSKTYFDYDYYDAKYCDSFRWGQLYKSMCGTIKGVFSKDKLMDDT